MSIATVHSRALAGIDAPPVTIEVHLSGGLPSLSIVGLPEAAVRESKDRVRSALMSSQFEYPARRVTVNLAPADLPKEGSRFDLAIAIGVLAASGQIPMHALAQYEFVGELALTGALRPVTGVLGTTLACQKSNRQLILPTENGAEAAAVAADISLVADSLLAVSRHLCGEQALALGNDEHDASNEAAPTSDLSDVRGQEAAKRALTICAAGGHNLLFYGPPGTGKSMLAARLPGLLPPLSLEEALETAALHSVAGLPVNAGTLRQRPYRSPHHTASAVSLVGGGGNPRPGEISLAHNGILFLDEIPEFDRKVLEVLREPLETGHVTIARAARSVDYPASFQLVAAMNPCPCGYAGDTSGRCRCTPSQIDRYRGRLSGPFLDRIDLHMEVTAPSAEQMHGPANGPNSDQVRQQVVQARDRMTTRQGTANAKLHAGQLLELSRLSDAARSLLERAAERFSLSARAHHRLIKVARTIADLAAAEQIEPTHMAEALQYRPASHAPQML